MSWRAPLRDMPGDHPTLDQGDGAEERQAEQGEKEDAGKGEIGAHVAGDDLDVEAEALVAADELGDGGTHGGVDRSIFEADEALRQGGRQAHPEEGAPRA